MIGDATLKEVKGGRVGHVAYWAIAGALTVFGFLGSFTIGLPFLVAGLLMCAIGFVRFRVGDAWAAKGGGVRWLAVVAGTVVSIFASLALTDTLDLLYQLSGEPFGESFYRDDGRPTEVGLIVGTTTASIATFLAFLGGGYVAGKVVGSFGGLVGALVAVLGVLLEGALSSGPLLDIQVGDASRGLFFAFLALLSGCLGGWLGGRSGPKTAKPGRRPRQGTA